MDAGITPFSTLGYFTDRKEWEKWFPIEWVVEMNEQIRLWFYSLLFMSVSLVGQAPYEQVVTHGSVVQEDGSKFHKSGFMIRFDEAAEKIGADTVRYLYAGANTSADVRFGYHLGDEARRKLLGLWNIYTFFITYAEIDDPKITDHLSDNLMDQWLESRVQSFIAKAVKSYESYNTAELIREFETCVDDVSNWYVRLCRKRFWKDTLDNDKQDAYNALYNTVKLICQVMAPVIPFMTETIWQNMIVRFGNAELSVHLSDFPRPKAVDADLLHEVETVREVIAGGMKLRNENQLKVRQPLSVLYVDATLATLCEKYVSAIKDELNVKKLAFISDWNTLCNEVLILDFKVAGRILKGDLSKVKELIENLTETEMASNVIRLKTNGEIKLGEYTLTADMLTLSAIDKPGIKRLVGELPLALCVIITPELKAEGAYREILRNCQVLRKEAGFEIADRVKLCFTTDSALLLSVINEYSANIEREVLAAVCKINNQIAEKTIDIDGEKLTITIAR